jgi:1,4-alpha-glucan branching enzyme
VNGYWYTNVAEAHAGDRYQFLLSTPKGELKRIDPYAREVTNLIGQAIVHDPTFDWQGDDFHLAPWNELFRDLQVKNHSNFAGLEKISTNHLPRLT